MENPNFIVPTPPAGDSSNRVADTAFVIQAIASTIATAIGTSAIAATQSEMEAGVSTAAFSSPGRQQFHPSAAKAWVAFTLAGGTPATTAGYNVSSLTDNGVGDTTINFSTAFSSINYVFIGSGMVSTSQIGFIQGPFTSVPTTTAFRAFSNNGAGASDNVYNYAVFFGDQP